MEEGREGGREGGWEGGVRGNQIRCNWSHAGTRHCTLLIEATVLKEEAEVGLGLEIGLRLA